MANLANAMAILARKRQEADGVPVTYRRGAYSVSVTAIRGQSILRLTDRAGGSRVERTQAEYLILASELILNGSRTEPQRGDTIEDAIDGRSLTFKVLPPGDGEPCWRRCDEAHTAYRIFCKLTQEA